MSTDSGIRVQRKRGYTVVFNDLLPLGQISAREWGVYVYLLSRPDGWQCRVSQLRKVFTEGRDALYNVLNKLVDHGLLQKEWYRDEGGMPRQRYLLDGDAQAARTLPGPGAPVSIAAGQSPNPENPDTANPDPGRPDTETADPENTDLVSKEIATTTEVNQSASLRESDGAAADASPLDGMPSPDDGRTETKRQSRLPDPFPITESMRRAKYARAAVKAGIDLEAEHERFLTYFRTRELLRTDWQHTWREWMHNALTYQARRAEGATSGQAQPPRRSPGNIHIDEETEATRRRLEAW